MCNIKKSSIPATPTATTAQRTRPDRPYDSNRIQRKVKETPPNRRRCRKKTRSGTLPVQIVPGTPAEQKSSMATAENRAICHCKGPLSCSRLSQNVTSRSKSPDARSRAPRRAVNNQTSGSVPAPIPSGNVSGAPARIRSSHRPGRWSLTSACERDRSCRWAAIIARAATNAHPLVNRARNKCVKPLVSSGRSILPIDVAATPQALKEERTNISSAPSKRAVAPSLSVVERFLNRHQLQVYPYQPIITSPESMTERGSSIDPITAGRYPKRRKNGYESNPIIVIQYIQKINPCPTDSSAAVRRIEK